MSVTPFEFPNANFTYTTTPLPNFIEFNPETLEFIIEPKSGNQGNYSITLIGDNGYGGVETVSFNVVVPNRSPVFIETLANQTWYTNKLSRFNLPSRTVVDPDGDPLTYSGNLLGSGALPQWMSSDRASGDLSGTPNGRNSYSIQLEAFDPFGGSAISQFGINVPNTAPVVINTISNQPASVDNSFTYTINSNTVYDADGDELTYSILSTPPFFEFDNVTRVLKGTPPPKIAQGITTKSYTIQVLVSDGHGGSCEVAFVVDVSGATYWKTVAQVFGYGISSLLVAYGLWEKRAVFLNLIRKEKYKKKEPEIALVGEEYSHQLKLKWHQVEGVKVLYNGRSLPPEKPFPDGLVFKDNKIQGTPTGSQSGYFTVRVVKNGGEYDEEFYLIIKKPGESDPENGEPKNHFVYLKDKILNLRNRPKNNSNTQTL